MNSRFELIKIHFPKEIEELRKKLTEFLFPLVNLKEFLEMEFLEELLNESIFGICPILFGAKCLYYDGICESCNGKCNYSLDIRVKFTDLKIELKKALETLYEKVKINVEFKKFFP